ncbi:hypothetical protein [Oligoflexus sp.]|uniref:hypothetical protein n=1 Tax=Oligoflexus sp. TaxID=1971216 RepID=UPI002D771A36|nr:hypothetical protein [Oligoflexus sp.]
MLSLNKVLSASALLLLLTACGTKSSKKDRDASQNPNTETSGDASKDAAPSSNDDQIAPSKNDQVGQNADIPAPISTKQSSELTLEPLKPQFYKIDVPGATNLNIVIEAKTAGTYTLTAELFNDDCKASSGQGKTSVSSGSSGTISATNNVCLKVSADNPTPIQFTFTVQ